MSFPPQKEFMTYINKQKRIYNPKSTQKTKKNFGSLCKGRNARSGLGTGLRYGNGYSANPGTPASQLALEGGARRAAGRLRHVHDEGVPRVPRSCDLHHLQQLEARVGVEAVRLVVQHDDAGRQLVAELLGEACRGYGRSLARLGRGLAEVWPSF